MIKFIKLFIAALKLEYKDVIITINKKFFSLAINKLDKTNCYVTQFPIFSSITGPYCPDFDQNINWAQMLGFISYLGPDYNKFIINLSDRQINECSKDILFSDACDLAKEYISLTT